MERGYSAGGGVLAGVAMAFTLAACCSSPGPAGPSERAEAAQAQQDRERRLQEDAERAQGRMDEQLEEAE